MATRGSSSIGAIQGGRVAVAVTLDDSKFVLGTAKVRASLKKLSAGLNTFSNGVIRAGMAIGVPLAAALRQFTEFDHQMRVVRAVTQSNEEQFARLTARARELGKTTSWTAREVAEGMTSLGRMGWKPKEIDAAISAMMDLARATDSDVATVSTLASNTMRAFKASSREATHYADVLTVAANKSSQTVVDIGEAMTIVGPLAYQAGQTFEDTAAALMVMANNGVRGSIAGTALRNALVKLNDSARQETLAKYNVQVRDAYGNMRKLARIMGDLFRNTQHLGTGELTSLSSEIFGLRGMLGGSVLVANINEVEDTIKSVNASMGEASRVARGMEEGLWGATKIAISAFQDLGIAIGNALTGDLERTLGRVTSLIRALGTWVKNNKEQVRKWGEYLLKAIKLALELKVALKLGAAIAGVWKFSTAFADLAKNILAAKTATDGLAAAQGAIGAAGVGGAVAGGAKGVAGAVANGAGGAAGAAAAGGGALGTAANGAIVASSVKGMAGKGGEAGAWAQWRASRASLAEARRNVAALQREADAKWAVRRAAEANARSAAAEAAESRYAMTAAQKELAARVATREAIKKSEQELARRVEALQANIYARGQQIGAESLRIRRNPAGPSGLNPSRAYSIQQRATLRAEQLADRKRLGIAKLLRESESSRYKVALRAEKQARGAAFAAGNRLARAQTAAAVAGKVSTAKKVEAVGSGLLLVGGMKQLATAQTAAKVASAGLAKSVGVLVARLGMWAAVAYEGYKTWKLWQKAIAAEANELAVRQDLKDQHSKAAEFFGTKLEEIEAQAVKYKDAMDTLYGIAKYGDQSESTKGRMVEVAKTLTGDNQLEAESLVSKVRYEASIGQTPESSAFMTGLMKELRDQAIKLRMLELQSIEEAFDTEEERAEAMKKHAATRGLIQGMMESYYGVGGITADEGAILRHDEELGKGIKTEDIEEAESSFADSLLSPYEKSIKELTKRQEQYAAFIKEKTDEMRALREFSYTTQGKDRLDGMIRGLEAQKAAFDAQIEVQKTRLTGEENLSRIDKVAGAFTDAIRQQVASGPEGQKMAESMRTRFVGSFEIMLGQLQKKLADVRKEATAWWSEGGEEVTDRERARIKSVSEAFVRVAEKLNDIRNLDIGEEVEKASSASTVGSYKASEVFGQLLGPTEYDRQTANNTREQNKTLKELRTLSREQKELLQDIATSNGMVFA